MKIKYRLLIIITILFLIGCAAGNENPRIIFNINSNWTFTYNPVHHIISDYISVEFNDSKWPIVGLPHTWQTYETTGDLHPFIKYASERDDPYWWKGWGYYRKHFTVSQIQRGKKVTVEFDGVQKYSRIYLNGEYVGDHKGGFNSFYFDLTPFIRFDKDNVLVVAVSNRRDDKYRIPPMTAGNWDIYGGIYRDARLVIKNVVHIPFQGSYKHEGGTFITTPHVNKNNAIVNIKTYVKNVSEQKTKVKLKTLVISPQGEIVKEIEKSKNIPSGVIIEFEQTMSPVQNPQLWSPKSPNIYRVKSKVYVNDRLVDQMESPLGFRWFHWDFEKNDLWLNGEKILIRGFNRHQEYPWVGDAIPKWLTVKDFSDMKNNLGINFFRAAHYPNDPQVYQLADSLGLIAVEEVPNIKSIDFDEDIQKQNVQEMIRRDRNHPSILFWSVGNETTDAADSKWVIEEDTTRLVHARKSKDMGDYVDHDHTNLDMENLLRVTIRGYFDKDNAPMDRNLKPDNGQFCSLEEWQHKMAMIEGASIRGSMKKNTVFWLYEDHGADREYKNSPLKHVNYKGWVDLYRFPKYIYYLTQAMYTNEPMVFIHPHNWTLKYLGQNKDFIVNSNCDNVELYVNNNKVGEAQPDYENFNTITFRNIQVTKGTLKVVGTKSGEKTVNSITMSGRPERLKLTVSHDTIKADKLGMAIVTADIVDKSGNRVINANNPLNWAVEGAVTLVGPEHYESDFDLFESMEGTGYIRIPVSNIIRSTNQPGKAIVSVSSPGLEPAFVEINVVPIKVDSRGITQPVLTENGRKKIHRNDKYSFEIRAVKVLNPINGNVKFDISDKANLLPGITGFLQKDNPEFDKDLPESKVLIDYLASYLYRMQGELIGDDFNFLAEKYNDCRLVSMAIDKSNLSFNLAYLLIKNYAEQIIIKGDLVDAEIEAKLFLNLPKERIVFKRVDNIHDSDLWIAESRQLEPVDCYFTDFEEFLKMAYPYYFKLSEEQKSVYRNYINTINPELEIENDKIIFSENCTICLPDPAKINY